MDEISTILKEAELAVHAAKTTDELDAVVVRFLGRKGSLTRLLETIGTRPAEERKTFGAAVNKAKAALENTIETHREKLQRASYEQLADAEWIDVTQPGTRPPEGYLHLVTHAIREITEIFDRIGFTRVRHPEVDWDWYAFESLNMPKDHPARDEWETFFVDAPDHPKFGKMVLTPHTSNGQVREMERGELPIRMINIAKCYRRQSDVSHVPMFHQFEGLLIDQNISITHLKGVLDHFAREFFGPDRRTRLRPFHFRFTEPSFEVDISCGVCGGTGVLTDGAKCRLCKSGWLELGGAGMVHPNVLKAGGIDAKKWGGFAFGWGVERTAMMRSGLQIDDIRILYKNDLRFLEQF
ncbi:MAG: phenylalanine--tRNA ligase subunit alpha [bacterium]|nr:phenylalanine--tRNA ligase subunit alpha [bacterium]